MLGPETKQKIKPWKKQFQEALRTFLNLPPSRLDKLCEGEKQSLARLDQMVKEEEKKIDEIKSTVC